MSRGGEEFGGLVRERSGWLVPLAVFFVTACLSAAMLAYYFAPSPVAFSGEQPAPTDATRPVGVTVGEVRFRIPANYILLASARRGGDMNEIGLTSILPNFEGYTLGMAVQFASNAPDSGVVNFRLASNRKILPEQERIDRVYLPQVQDARGETGPYGLQQYSFVAESGYHNEDLFIGSGDDGRVVLLCDKLGPDVPSPNCFRDMALANGLQLSYRFKRGRLADWRKIDSGIRVLVDRFTAGS